jgi:spore coat protein U-like protein
VDGYSYPLQKTEFFRNQTKEKGMSIKFNQSALKRAIAAGIILGSAGFSTAVFAMRTASDNMAVITTVGISCTIDVADLTFTMYDPTFGVDNDSTGSVTSTCTTGGAVVLTLGQGSSAESGSTDAVPIRRMVGTSVGNSGTFLAYGLYQENGRTTVFGNTSDTGGSFTATGGADVTTVYGRIPKNQSAALGSFIDSVSVTLTY